MEIKGIILDVDGVIIGEKKGRNFPFPNQEVINSLKKAKSKGIKISLCTAKPFFAIKKIVEDAKLDNPHITDGGSVVINPIKNQILSSHFIETSLAQKVMDVYLKNQVYAEFYTLDDYFLQKDQACELTKKHAEILQKQPKKVFSLLKEASNKRITKIMPVAKNEQDKERVIELFELFEKELMLSWGVHPTALPFQFGIITPKGISKKSAAEQIIQSEKINFNNVLGIGDSSSDWQFIELCKYGGAVGNASEKLKELVLSKGKRGFVGPNVDDNGIINILKHFDVI